MKAPYISVVHIHTDTKFIDGTSFFKGPLFHNKVVVIGDKNAYNGIYSDRVVYFKHKADDLQKIIDLCASANLVVLYGLDIPKSIIANRIPKNVMVAWRFFGAELYGRRIDTYLSPLTRNVYKLSTFEKVRAIIQKVLRLLGGKVDFTEHVFTRTLYLEREFIRAIKRINFFFGQSKPEYEQLRSFWVDLPSFIQAPFGYWTDTGLNNVKKDNVIILGNSKSIFNNHFDILEIIDHSSLTDDYKYILPFSYGAENNYTKKLRTRVSNNAEYIILENFVCFEKYIRLFSKAKAAVFNGYRQMAMGNIFLALNNGVKIYLSEKNVILRWLKDLGFIIFRIDEFQTDLKTGSLELLKAEKMHNLNLYREIRNKYGKDSFQKKVYNVVVYLNKPYD